MRRIYLLFHNQIILYVAVVLGLPTLAHTNTLESAERIITVVGETDYPPYSFLDDNGAPSGFQTELIQAVGRVRLAEQYSWKISLLITDVIMPEMNGRLLADNLQENIPHLKCIFMSGYTANVIAHQGILDEDVFFITKPFTASDLTAKVREVLESKTT